MDQFRASELVFRLEHRHGDGAWGQFEAHPSHHSPADHDPERDWANGQIYACSSCDEKVRITPVDDEIEPTPPQR